MRKYICKDKTIGVSYSDAEEYRRKFNHKRQTLGERILSHITWGLFSYVLFILFLFRRVPFLGASGSMLLLTGIVIVFLCGGFLLIRNHNHRSGLLVTILLPLELYSVLSLYRYFTAGVWLSLAAAVMGAALVCLWGHRRGWRWQKKVLFSRAVVAICFLSVLVFGLVIRLHGGFPVPVPVQATAEQRGFDPVFDEHQDTLKVLCDGWMDQPLSGKLDILQTVVNVEVSGFKLSDSIEVRADILPNGVGGYDPTHNRIVIDAEHLEHAEYVRDILKPLFFAFFCNFELETGRVQLDSSVNGLGGMLLPQFYFIEYQPLPEDIYDSAAWEKAEQDPWHGAMLYADQQTFVYLKRLDPSLNHEEKGS